MQKGRYIRVHNVGKQAMDMQNKTVEWNKYYIKEDKEEEAEKKRRIERRRGDLVLLSETHLPRSILITVRNHHRGHSKWNGPNCNEDECNIFSGGFKAGYVQRNILVPSWRTHALLMNGLNMETVWYSTFSDRFRTGWIQKDILITSWSRHASQMWKL